MNLDICQEFSACDFADHLPRSQVAGLEIRPLWTPIPRVVGHAYTVLCPAGDNLMMHAAIHKAPPGSVIVAQACKNFAVAGGNVAAFAQQRGIKGFIVDGVVRDLAEIRRFQFPVFARGVIPKPGSKSKVSTINPEISIAGIKVSTGDIVIADEEGLVFVKQHQLEDVIDKAKARVSREAAQTLTQWGSNHYEKIAGKMQAKGLTL